MIFVCAYFFFFYNKNIIVLKKKLENKINGFAKISKLLNTIKHVFYSLETNSNKPDFS